MHRRILLALFAATCLAQLAVPLSMIYKREATLKHGEVFKFKTAPVDPYDAFRGRYVALNYEQAIIPGHWPAAEYRHGRIVYALLDRDDDGYALITGLQLRPPPNEPFLRVRVAWAGETRLVLNLPFDRYYMDEFEAPRAEREFMWPRHRHERNAYARTRVHNGFGVIEELIVDGQPISDWLRSIENHE